MKQTNQLQVHRDEFSLRFHKQHRGCVLPCHGHRKETILRVSPHSHNHTNILSKTGGNEGLWSTCGWCLKEFPFQAGTVIKTGWCTFSLLQIGITRFFSVQRREDRKEKSCKGTFFFPKMPYFQFLIPITNQVSHSASIFSYSLLCSTSGDS